MAGHFQQDEKQNTRKTKLPAQGAPARASHAQRKGKSAPVIILNIALVAVVLGAIGFLIFRGFSIKNEKQQEATVPTISEKAAATPDNTVMLEPLTVGVVQHSEQPSSQLCYEGFLQQLEERGIADVINVDYVLEENNDKCIAEIKKLVEKKVDLIYAIGPFASKHAAELTSEIPIVFASVSDPGEHGLVDSNENPGGNVTGVSSYTPCFEQIDLIKLLLPEATSVGALYCQTDEEAVTQALIAEKECEQVKLSFTKFPVIKASQIAGSLEELAKEGIEVIYVPVDELIYKNISTLADFSIKNKIPIICGDERTLKKGCFATSLIDYNSIGKDAADLLCEILVEEKAPASIPVVYSSDDYLHLVNKTVMENLKIVLMETAKQQVTIKSY